jgi:hypothetical protein
MVNDGSWPHPARLPLAGGWSGSCMASGEARAASEAQVREFCNLGYAAGCPHLPAERDWDAIRFAVARTSREQVTLCFTCERAHEPMAHGELSFNLATGSWGATEADARVLRLANSYLQTYLARRTAGAA